MSSSVQRKWIEISFGDVKLYRIMSSSVQRKWIEILQEPVIIFCVWCLPLYRGSGLKCACKRIEGCKDSSSSVQRKWIEILYGQMPPIAFSMSSSVQRKWIEIFYPAHHFCAVHGLPLYRGSGLKWKNVKKVDALARSSSVQRKWIEIPVLL